MATQAGIALNRLNNIERGVVDPKKSTWDRVVKVFMDAGVEFVGEGQASLSGGEGVRLRERQP